MSEIPDGWERFEAIRELFIQMEEAADQTYVKLIKEYRERISQLEAELALSKAKLEDRFTQLQKLQTELSQETERCARIAETSRRETGFQTAGDERRAQEIAAAIRG